MDGRESAAANEVTNQTLLVIGYGSLLSGYGILAERRGGASRLMARDAFAVTLGNARRGFAKPSTHGDYLAMDLEPIRRGEPIVARVAADGSGAHQFDVASAGANETQTNGRRADGIGAVGLVFDREWAALISRREEYAPQKFLELIDRADAAGAALGDFLFDIARRTDFDLLAYRTELRKLTGYTSPGYIFHPVPLEDGRVAIAAIGSGYEGSGDPAVRSRRSELGMDRLLTMREAMEVTSLTLDRAGQAGYFAECVLGGIHGLAVGDLMAEMELESDWGRELLRRLAHAAPGEPARFMTATSLDSARYRVRFSARAEARLAALLEAAAHARE